MSNDALQNFRAEQLLGDDSFILKQINQLKHDLRYNSDGNEVSLDDYYKRMDLAVDKLPRIELDTQIPPGTEDEYGIRLSSSYEKITDECERIGHQILEFLSILKNAEKDIRRLKTEFAAWYTLSAQLMVSAHSIKFPPNQIKALADSEFSRLIDTVDVQVDHLILMAEHLHEVTKSTKKIGGEKYNQGRDQINLSYTSRMASNMAAIAPSRSDNLIREEEVEEEDNDVPAYVSKQPAVGSRPSPVETVRELLKDPDPERNYEFREPTKVLKIVEPAKNNIEDLQKVLDVTNPGETVMVRWKEDVAPVIEGIKDNLRVNVEGAENAEEAVAAIALLNTPAPAPSTPRRRLLMDDEDLM